MILHHITILTGHGATHRLDTLNPAVVSACASLLPSGGPVPGFPAFRVSISGASFQLFRGRDLIAWCVIGDHRHQQSWDLLVETQRKIAPLANDPKMPKGRWLAVVLGPGILSTSREDLGWVGDFERCLAAAIISNL